MPELEFAGTLDHRFSVERPNDAGGVVAHPTIAKIWGSLLLLSGIESPAIQANSDFRVVTQYRTDLTVRDRLREGTRVFEIVSPPADPMGHRRQIEMLVKEQV